MNGATGTTGRAGSSGRESYAYDGNGNRPAKTTPWGTIVYSYDAENRLIKQGDIVYTYDQDGNLLSEQGLRRQAAYQYNGQNRMVYSQVTNTVDRSRVTSRYAYDALGRRTIVQDEGSSPVRTLYDGTSFQVVRSGVMFNDGRFTTLYSEGIQWTTNSGTEGSRYRWVSEGQNETRTRSTGDYSTVTVRYTGISVTLYGNGEAVAVSRSASEGTRGGAAYLGKDLMGSVMTATNEYGALEERYEYDAFGKPYVGDLTQGMNLGYTGKPYDTVTGLYNYGYRDYKPEAARFTTVDPVRDGTNWFAYVNNDPVNWVDWWGLSASDKQSVRVTTAGMEFNLVTVPSILTGNLNTITKGFLDASFYINDSPKPAFTAHYTYSVNQKTGFEITVLGLSTTAGTATKTFDSPKTNEEIARDFQSAGTVSQYVGVSVVVGGTISSSTSGGWVFTQSSFGADGGLKINAAGGTQYTETRLDVNSIQDWK